MKDRSKNKGYLEFSPDYFCKVTWIRRCGMVLLILTLPILVTCFVSEKITLTEFKGIEVFILLLACLFSFIIIIGSRSNAKLPEDLRYVISDAGVDIMVKTDSVAHVPWETVEDVVVDRGPCEPHPARVEPLVGMFYSGPYGVYITMRTKNPPGDYIEKNEIFNLALPDCLKAPYEYPVIYLCTKISRKKCQQLRNQILEIRKNGLKEIIKP